MGAFDHLVNELTGKAEDAGADLKIVTTRLTTDLLDRLDEYTEQFECSRSELLRQIIDAGITELDRVDSNLARKELASSFTAQEKKRNTSGRHSKPPKRRSAA